MKKILSLLILLAVLTTCVFAATFRVKALPYSLISFKHSEYSKPVASKYGFGGSLAYSAPLKNSKSNLGAELSFKSYEFENYSPVKELSLFATISREVIKNVEGINIELGASAGVSYVNYEEFQYSIPSFGINVDFDLPLEDKIAFDIFTDGIFSLYCKDKKYQINSHFDTGIGLIFEI